MKVMVSLSRSSPAMDKAKLIFDWVMSDDSKERAVILKGLQALKIPGTVKYAGRAWRQITVAAAVFKRAQKSGILELKATPVSSWSTSEGQAQSFWTQVAKGQNVIIAADLKKTDNVLYVPAFVESLKLSPDEWKEIAGDARRAQLFKSRTNQYGEREVIVLNSERLLKIPADDFYPVR